MDEAGAGRPMESILAAYPAHPVLDLIMGEHPPRYRVGWRPIWGHGPGVHRRSCRAVQALDGSFDVFSTRRTAMGLAVRLTAAGRRCFIAGC